MTNISGAPVPKYYFYFGFLGHACKADRMNGNQIMSNYFRNTIWLMNMKSCMTENDDIIITIEAIHRCHELKSLANRFHINHTRSCCYGCFYFTLFCTIWSARTTTKIPTDRRTFNPRWVLWRLFRFAPSGLILSKTYIGIFSDK